MTEANDRLLILLKEVFGWKEFRPVQKQVIDSVYQGSADKLVMQLLGNKKASKEDLDSIREILNKLDK